MIRAIVDFHYWLANKDIIWMPFSFLKPAPLEPITFKRTVLMTFCFGGFSTLLLTLMALSNNSLTVISFFYLLMSSCLSFFVWFNLVTRPLWNLKIKNK